MSDSYGLDVERWLRRVAAHHGVPDFVFRPLDVAKDPRGRTQREVGDFLLWVGDAVAIVSSKSREPTAAERETQDRRTRWFDKQVSGAFDEIKGVVRTLRRAEASAIVLESERGVKVPWTPKPTSAYVGVILLHASPPDEDWAPPLMDDGVPTIAMLAEDWNFLNRVLPSTMALIRYLGRRLAYIPRCPMGSEADILALILEHENLGKPIEIPRGGLPKGYFGDVAARHPDWFLGGDPDDHFSYVIDAMIEGAADADPTRSSSLDPLGYMQIVEFLDRIPLLTRVTIGRGVVERCRRVGEHGGRIATRFAVPHGMLAFVASDARRDERVSWLKSITMARHSQALDGGAPASLLTLGVTTDPIPSEHRTHDFVLIQGGIRSDATFRTRRDDLFGAIDVEPMLAYWRDHPA